MKNSHDLIGYRTRELSVYMVVVGRLKNEEPFFVTLSVTETKRHASKMRKTDDSISPSSG